MKVGQAKPFRQMKLSVRDAGMAGFFWACWAYTYYDDDAREQDNRNARPHKHGRAQPQPHVNECVVTMIWIGCCCLVLSLAFPDAARALKVKWEKSSASETGQTKG